VRLFQHAQLDPMVNNVRMAELRLVQVLFKIVLAIAYQTSLELIVKMLTHAPLVQMELLVHMELQLDLSI